MVVALVTSLLVVSSTGAVLASNSAPTAHDQTFTTSGEPIEVTLYAHDADGDELTFAVLAEPQKGTLSGTAPSFLYSPSAAFDGSDSFTWKANDGSNDSTVATVSIGGPSATESQTVDSASTVQATTTSAVSFRSSSTASSRDTFVTSLTIPRPSGVATGDLMWMHLSTVRPEPAPNVLVTNPIVPAGWILIREIDVGNAVRSFLYRKTGGIEPATGYTVGFGLPVQVAAGVGVWSGADTNWFALREATAVAATSVTVPGVFAVNGGRVAGFFATLGFPVTVPTQMTRQWHSATTGINHRLRSLSVGADEPTTGPINSRTAKSSNQIVWIAHLISMRPKA